MDPGGPRNFGYIVAKITFFFLDSFSFSFFLFGFWFLYIQYIYSIEPWKPLGQSHMSSPLYIRSPPYIDNTEYTINTKNSEEKHLNI